MAASRGTALGNTLLNNELKESLLPAGSSSDDIVTIDIASSSFSNELGLEQALKANLEAITTMPEKISKKHAKKIAFMFGSSGAISVLYVTGGEGKGLIYEISGPAVNVIQGFGFAAQAFDYLKHQIEGSDNSKVAMALTLFGAAISTAVPTVAAYQLATETYAKYIDATLTSVGVLPCNIAGIGGTIDRIRNWRAENPKVRSFISDRYRESLPEYDRVYLEKDQSTFTKFLAFVLGMGLVVPMTTSQTGSVCSSSAFAEDNLHAGIHLGTIIGLIANFPMIAIGILASFGLAGELADLACTMASAATNTVQNLIYGTRAQHTVAKQTRGDQVQLATFFALGAGCLYLSLYSAATSETLYEENCNFNGFLDDFLRENVEKGTVAFNAILTLKTLFSLIKLGKEAYDPNPLSQAIYKIRAIDQNIRENLSTKELEGLAMKHYPHKKSEWEKKPSAATLLARTSPVASVSRTTVSELSEQDEARARPASPSKS